MNNGVSPELEGCLAELGAKIKERRRKGHVSPELHLGSPETQQQQPSRPYVSPETHPG